MIFDISVTGVYIDIIGKFGVILKETVYAESDLFAFDKTNVGKNN